MGDSELTFGEAETQERCPERRSLKQAQNRRASVVGTVTTRSKAASSMRVRQSQDVESLEKVFVGGKDEV